jgi:hypothetical protein
MDFFCKPVPSHTTRKCLFDFFLETAGSYGMDWKNIVCSDGAKAITGKKSGLIVKLKPHMPTAV